MPHINLANILRLKARLLPIALAICTLAAFFGTARAAQQTPPVNRCTALAEQMSGRWPDASTRVLSTTAEPAGLFSLPPVPGGPPTPISFNLPAHCNVLGVMRERTGADGRPYAIHFRVRLPNAWNDRFLFQGGGGSNGVVGDALGLLAPGAPPALLQGFAVVSQDSGHDNEVDSDPARGGAVAFGFDPQARADYGHASLKVVADAAKALVSAYYGRPSRFAYFVGCSKGGQEGMVFAQQYPEEFDGIIAAAPGFSLPRAALAEAWDVQSVAKVAGAPTTASVITAARFASTFSDADLALVRDVVLAACDADDGVRDGMVSAFDQCTDRKVLPLLSAKTCHGEKSLTCLSAAQIHALEEMHAGPRDAHNHALYSDWQWDAGIAGFGWRLWKLGSADGKIPALNIALGGASLAAVFTTPPTPVPNDLQSNLDYELGFDLSRDAGKIDATNTHGFSRSAWQEISARSSNLAAFRARGGKLLVPHGVSDPVFSIRDTIAWYGEVDRQSGGNAAQFVRVFAVPGMNHCGGGPATDNFDAFGALQTWVEHQRAPDRIIATAGPTAPWPGRTRPLCAYPKAAYYRRSGDIEKESSFECR